MHETPKRQYEKESELSMKLDEFLQAEIDKLASEGVVLASVSIDIDIYTGLERPVMSSCLRSIDCEIVK